MERVLTTERPRPSTLVVVFLAPLGMALRVLVSTANST